MAGLVRGGGGAEPPPLTGPVFDSAALMVEAALAGHGVALAPAACSSGSSAGRAARPFRLEVAMGGYWLTSLKSRKHSRAMAAFRSWILAAAQT